MILIKDRLTIRNAGAADAEQLCAWWNDGAVMAHAGFPNGLHETPEQIRASLAADTDNMHRRHIIALDGKPIGEMNYRNKGGKTAEIGIKICDFSQQEHGFGTTLLATLIDALFTYYGYEKVILDTNVKNERAQHVYEQKLGFQRLGVRKNAWNDQLGESQSSIDYDLTKARWQAMQEEPLAYIHIRPETPQDYHAVDLLHRDAAIGNNGPETDDHLIVHKTRRHRSFLPALSFVAELNGKLAGSIMYTKIRLATKQKSCDDCLSLQHLRVAPWAQKQGVGAALVRHTVALAKQMGSRAILLCGIPDYYLRLGFQLACEFGIGERSENCYAMPLYDGALDGMAGGAFHELDFPVTKWQLRRFNRRFPPPDLSQLRPIACLLEQLPPPARAAVAGLGLQYLSQLRKQSENNIASLPGVTPEDIATVHRVMKENGLGWGRCESLRFS